MYSTVANQKRKSGEKKRHELETEAGGYGGSGGNRGQRRGDGGRVWLQRENIFIKTF